MGHERALGVIGCLLACRCTMLNPAFDEDHDNGAAHDASATGVASESESGPTPGTESGSDDDSGSTGDPDTTESSDSTDSTDDTGDADTDNPDDAETGSGAGTLEVPASLCACRGAEHTPAQCAFYASAGQGDAVVIDQASDTGDYLVACLMFDLDDTLSDKTINQVILEMHTTAVNWASSDAAGDIWAVEPFTMADLDNALPQQLGVTPLASKPGVAPVNVPIQWQLPIDAVTGNAQIYLCAYPLSEDGLYFHSHTGTFPPKLYIEYE